MFENAGEIVTLVLAVVVTWIAARASAGAGPSTDHTVLSGLRSRENAHGRGRSAGSASGGSVRRAGPPAPGLGEEVDHDLIRIIETREIASTA